MSKLKIILYTFLVTQLTILLLSIIISYKYNISLLPELENPLPENEKPPRVEILLPNNYLKYIFAAIISIVLAMALPYIFPGYFLPPIRGVAPEFPPDN